VLVLSTLVWLHSFSGCWECYLLLWQNLVPDEGSEGRGAEAHVALDSEEAYEESCDSLHQPQVVELFGVLRVNLLQTQRRKISHLIWTPAL